MKSPMLFFVLFALLVGGAIAVSQSQASNLPQPEQTLIYLPVRIPEDGERLPAGGVTIYAHVNGRDGTALVAGAEAAGLAALAEAGLSYTVLEEIPADASYYLAYARPAGAAVDWAEAATVLWVDPGWRLLRATPEAAGRLAEQGVSLQRVTFEAKPFASRPAGPAAPADIEPDPLVQAMMDQVISDTVYLYDGGLSGEWPVTIGGSSYTLASRHTYSGEPIHKATQFVGEHLANLGMEVEYHQWSGATYPNVIGTMTGLNNPDEIYIVSAHLDDMPSGAVAPGADDNASGVVATLIAADIFSQYQWDCTLRFALWTGEEQGLLGSEAYAQRAYGNDENIAGVLNLDMIAWNTPSSSRDIEVHATNAIPATLEQAQLFVDVINAYDLNLIPHIDPTGTGASDHASFWQYGYPAILGIEDFGDFNPYYHTTSDLLEHADMDYFTEFVRAGVATFAHLNGCLIPDGLGYMNGHVSEAGSGDPIADATVTMQAAGGQPLTAVSDAAGYYTRTLMANTYTVTAEAYGYLPLTVAGITVVTDTVTTQDMALSPAPTYTVSGTVTALDTGLPLWAQVAFEDTPVSVLTNPDTGHYQATVYAGSYTMRVTAASYQTAERPVVVDEEQTQDFALAPLPCILLVDDDNDSPDVRAYYTEALDSLGLSYDVFAAGSGDGPALAQMEGYQVVIWFSGDKYGSAGPNDGDESNLAAYLDGGGRLFLDSQDYLYDMGLTTFAQQYLGVGSYSDDAGNATTKYGVADDPIGDGLGPFSLSYPADFSDYGDMVQSGNGGSLAFRSSAAGGNGLDVDKDGGNWKTVFFATSWVAVAHANADNGEALMERILDWFGGCQCQPVQIVDVATTVDACLVSFDPDYTGTPPVGWDWLFSNGNPASSSSENPAGIDFGASGSYTYTVTAANCGGALTDSFTDVVTVQCEACQPITAVLLALATPAPLYSGLPVAFTADILPGTAAPPYSYTLAINGIAAASGQSNSNPMEVDYTFTQAGVYTVTLAVSNCGLTLPASHWLNVTVLPSFGMYLPAIQRP